MYLTEKEIFGQDEALAKTHEHFQENAGRIRKFVERVKPRSLTWIGCGSSYCLCKSAEVSARNRLRLPASAIAAGDLFLNLDHYRGPLKGGLLIAPSRSGETGEVIRALQKARRPVLAVCGRENSKLSKLANFRLELPWIHDESVCQTRSISNLYAANLLLIAALAKDNRLFSEIGAAIKNGPAFADKYRETLRELGGQRSWNQVVVLADSELCGIAEAGALSFKEICRTPSNYYHLLDVRHGPILLIDDWTLVIMALNRTGLPFSQALIKDLQKKSPIIATIASGKNAGAADYHFELPAYQNFGVAGLTLAFITQALSLHRALARGLNPDQPAGLEPWIKI